MVHRWQKIGNYCCSACLFFFRISIGMWQKQKVYYRQGQFCRWEDILRAKVDADFCLLTYPWNEQEQRKSCFNYVNFFLGTKCVPFFHCASILRGHERFKVVFVVQLISACLLFIFLPRILVVCTCLHSLVCAHLCSKAGGGGVAILSREQMSICHPTC